MTRPHAPTRQPADNAGQWWLFKNPCVTVYSYGGCDGTIHGWSWRCGQCGGSNSAPTWREALDGALNHTPNVVIRRVVANWHGQRWISVVEESPWMTALDWAREPTATWLVERLAGTRWTRDDEYMAEVRGAVEGMSAPT